MTSGRLILFLFSFLFAALNILPSLAEADIYSYTDKGGTVVMTNDRDAIPAKQRKNVKVTPEEKKPGGMNTQQRNITSKESAELITEQAPARKGAEGGQTGPVPWIKIIGSLLGAFVILMLLLRVVRSLASPQLARIIMVALFLGTFVTGYKLYADHLVGSYFSIKGKFLKLYAKANQREGLIPTPAPTERKEP